jgi:hypothetical protein
MKEADRKEAVELATGLVDRLATGLARMLVNGHAMPPLIRKVSRGEPQELVEGHLARGPGATVRMEASTGAFMLWGITITLECLGDDTTEMEGGQP